MKQGLRTRARRAAPRPLHDWPAEFTRSESAWSTRPDSPLLPRAVAAYGFLRDRIHIVTGAAPLPDEMSDQAIDATLSLMLRRGQK